MQNESCHLLKRQTHQMFARMVGWFQTLWFPLLAACLSFGLLQIDGIERSFLGAPDREMLQSAFKLREGVARGSGDPVLWLDIDYDTLASHAQMHGRASAVSFTDATGPSPLVPRDVLASTLAYARKPSATLVVLDVDIGWAAADPDGETKLEAELKTWAADKNAPLLVLAREILYLPDGATLVPTRFDDIVSQSSNIMFGGVSMQSGGSGVKEFVAGQCYKSQNTTLEYLPSVVSIAEAAQRAYRVNTAAPNPSRANSIKSKIRNGAISSRSRCTTQASLAGNKNGVVSWHIGYSYPSTIRAAPVSNKWPHQNLCQLSALPATATRISIADLLADPQAASAAPLCRRMVIIGGDNAISKDRSATPIGMLPGPIVLANAMRGHFDTGPILRGNWSVLRLSLQIALLIVTVFCIVWAFDWISKLRQRLQKSVKIGLRSRVLLFFTHPLCFKFVVAFVTFGVGVLVTALSLELGFWGLLSAPAYFATLYEAWRQINADK